jgi:hypothetical protein
MRLLFGTCQHARFASERHSFLQRRVVRMSSDPSKFFKSSDGENNAEFFHERLPLKTPSYNKHLRNDWELLTGIGFNFLHTTRQLLNHENLVVLMTSASRLMVMRPSIAQLLGGTLTLGNDELKSEQRALL